MLRIFGNDNIVKVCIQKNEAFQNQLHVIPAKAGIHKEQNRKSWIPASRLGRDDKNQKTHPAIFEKIVIRMFIQSNPDINLSNLD
jgi:hypothetical protein